MMSPHAGLARTQSRAHGWIQGGPSVVDGGVSSPYIPAVFPGHMPLLRGYPGPGGGVAEWLKALVC